MLQVNIKLALLVLFLSSPNYVSTLDPWMYTCQKNYLGQDEACVRMKTPGKENGGISFAECKLTCGLDLQVWPKIHGDSNKMKSVIAFDPKNVKVTFDHKHDHDHDHDHEIVEEWLNNTLHQRLSWLENEADGGDLDLEFEYMENNEGEELEIQFTWLEDSPKIKRSTDESYTLKMDSNTRIINLNATSYFGLRHGLETLSQLWEFDDVNRRFLILEQFNIEDRPEFKHRGVMLDSARNFIPLDVIRRVIDGMSFNKLNVLHWHITDTQSFPIKLEKFPETTGKMAQFGAYGPNHIYTVDQVKDLVQYATERGVRIIPEFDAPSHVGNGWQFPGGENFTVCRNKQPWESFCVEPPCGQLNPMVDDMYVVLRQIFEEYYDIFQFDSFHYGGDEVDFRCWESEEAVTKPMKDQGLSIDTDGFVSIWTQFQNKAQEIIDELVSDPEHILWTSTLTSDEYISNVPKDYTIQIWTDSADTQIETLIKNKYNVIFSNVDALYMDCGFSAFIGKGNNWCSPYKSWQTVYENDLYKLLENHGGTDDDRSRVMGAEIALWTENARLVEQTNRLIKRNVQSDAVQPEYCRLNHGECYIGIQNDQNNAKSMVTQSYIMMVMISIFVFM